ncbi:hypothetical protein B0H13DRAFT_1898185 [Mycena leptocephala]|nr:hypothetical protein B0H13DRAFT_1898185 [Mycena leptocephala]
MGDAEHNPLHPTTEALTGQSTAELCPCLVKILSRSPPFSESPFQMAITHNISARTASPTPSENSDQYYEDFDNHYISPSPAPSQTADAYRWESDATPVPMNSHNATPTQPARMSSTASVTEISRDEFLPLAAPAPTPATTTKAHTKASKGKGNVTAKAETPTNNRDDPFLAANIECTKALSLGLPLSLTNATEGASSPHRPAEAGSPSKHLHSNTAGDAAPAPFAAIAAAMPIVDTTIAPTAIPVVAAGIAPIPATAAGPVHTAAATTTLNAAAAPAPLEPAPAAARLDNVATPLDAATAPSTLQLLPIGYPVTVYSADGMINTIPANLFMMYEAVPHPKFFLRPGDFTLGTPPTAANSTSPDLWLIAGISAHLAQAIIDQWIISSSRITLFAFPYDMPIVGFVGVFAGFTLPNNVTGTNAAYNLICTMTEANNEISQFVQTHRDAFGPQVSICWPSMGALPRIDYSMTSGCHKSGFQPQIDLSKGILCPNAYLGVHREVHIWAPYIASILQPNNPKKAEKHLLAMTKNPGMHNKKVSRHVQHAQCVQRVVQGIRLNRTLNRAFTS